jgi:hypothetical protein
MNSNSLTVVFRQLQHLLAYSALAFCSPMVTSRKKYSTIHNLFYLDISLFDTNIRFSILLLFILRIVHLYTYIILRPKDYTYNIFFIDCLRILYFCLTSYGPTLLSNHPTWILLHSSQWLREKSLFVTSYNWAKDITIFFYRSSHTAGSFIVSFT